MAEFDRVADIYDATRKRPDETMRPAIEAMVKVLGSCDTVLDVGVETGRFAGPLRDKGLNMVGVDISLAMMEKAREKGLENLVRGDIHNLPFREGSFDAAVIILVLHLVRDWVRVVREVGRVSGGAVVSMVGRTEGPQIRQAYLRLRREAGYTSLRFDEGEEGLCPVVPPVKLILVSDRWEEVDADDRIPYFENRGSSITWEVPEAVHRAVIGKLRSLFGGRVLRRRSIDELAVWKANQLRALQVNT